METFSEPAAGGFVDRACGVRSLLRDRRRVWTTTGNGTPTAGDRPGIEFVRSIEPRFGGGHNDQLGCESAFAHPSPTCGGVLDSDSSADFGVSFGWSRARTRSDAG